MLVGLPIGFFVKAESGSTSSLFVMFSEYINSPLYFHSCAICFIHCLHPSEYSSSLFHQRADDYAFTRPFQTFLLLVDSPILVRWIFFSFRSFQVFLCLTLLLHLHLLLPLQMAV